ncbi:MAG TPA: permease [Planctomycetaceae bacterium]|nr:permease [Planctomycetaceae bacterium]HIQ22217.1 permease [Planctomycetota bacterium]
MNAFSFNLSDFVFVWWALLYEAMPFVVLGALLSGILEVAVSREAIARLFPRSRLVGIGLSACLGLIFPMCECGIVPVARRLVRKGVPAACAVSYMLASPVINPLVILSTAVAFRGRGSWAVAGLRVGLAYLVAVAVGLVVWKWLGEENVLLEGNASEGDHAHVRSGGFLADVLVHAATDFLVIGSTLVFGAGLAALINSGLSRSAMEPFVSNPWTAVGSMSVLAVALNLCSEADAFVAASFYAFPLAAKLAFLVLGPMVDIKLLAMYATVFRPRAVTVIMGTTTLLVVLLCVSGYLWIPLIGSAAW